MATTKYSHAFLVGSFNGELKPEQLENDEQNWTQEIIPSSPQEDEKRYEEDRGYNGLCGLYYKAHVDAMLEADGLAQQRPEFLQDVHHYYNVVEEEKQNVVFKAIKDGYDYKIKILRLHIFTFPLGISLFAIEIDDTGNELNALTMGHFTLSRWAWGWDKNFSSDVKDSLNSALQPLKSLLVGQDLVNLICGGNKLKLFQSIQLEIEEPDDKLLYEIGSSSAIGCINNQQDRYCPSADYWQQIVKENSVSTFRNWKALALMDSFTILGAVGSFDVDDFNYLYFPLIYLRCIFEKTFCFSRNIAYREDEKEIIKSLPEEINLMEKFYFYDNISYNFQPNLLYKAMAKGLGIKEEREELSKQIKETTKKKREEQKEKEEKRFNNILAGVSIFAVISVIWDFCSIVKDAFGVDSNHNVPTYARIFIAIGIILIIFLWHQIYKSKGNEKG